MNLAHRLSCCVACIAVALSMTSAANPAPPFLSYDDDFAVECSDQVRQELLASGRIDIADVAMKLSEPLPMTAANGQVHINIMYKAKMKVLGLQAVSTSGWPIGKFPPATTTLHCSPDWARPSSVETSFKLANVPVTQNVPAVTKHTFPTPEGWLHAIWVYNASEILEVNTGFQIHAYVVPKSATCFAFQPGPVYKMTHSIIGEWPMAGAPPSDYKCHGGNVPAANKNPPPPAEFDSTYMQSIEDLPVVSQRIVERGDFCPKDRLFNAEQNGPLKGPSKDLLRNFLKFDVYSVGPGDVPGWYHFSISTDYTHSSRLKFKRIAIRVLAKSGIIIGSFLRSEEVPCTDLQGGNSSAQPFYSFTEPPSDQSTDTPAVVEVSFDDFVSDFSIFWSYRVVESVDVVAGIQIQAYILNITDGTNIISGTAEYFSRQFSKIYTPAGLNYDLQAGDVVDAPICKAKLVKPVNLVVNDTKFKLNYMYKKKCEAFGLKQGKEAVNIWPQPPPVNNDTFNGTDIVTPNSTINHTDSHDQDLTTMVPQILVPPPLIPRGNVEHTGLDYIDNDYVDYSDVRGKLNDSANQAEMLVVNKDQFYDGCNELKTCIGWKDPDCLKTKSCVVAVSFRKMKDRCMFELVGQTSKFVALGISRDDLMGSDSVIECVREDHNNLRIYLSYNGPRETQFRTNNRIKIQNDSIALLKGWVLEEESLLFCAFHRKRIVTIRNNTFDLAKEKFYLLMAHGDTAYQKLLGGIGPHNRGSYATKIKYALMDPIGKTKGLKYAETTHGIAMVIAWVFCYPVALFMARYFKETYFGKYFCGMSIWFGSHVILMCVTLFLIVVTIILVAYELGGGTSPFQKVYQREGMKGWYFHNVASYTLIGVFILNGVLGVFVRKRRHLLLHFVHGFLGHAVLFLAFTIMLKSKNMTAGLYCESSPVLVTWIVLYFVIHVLMSYQVCYTDYVHGLNISRVYLFPLLLIAETKASEEEAPGALARKFLLGFFMFLCFVIMMILVVQMALEEPDCVELAHRHNFTKELII